MEKEENYQLPSSEYKSVKNIGKALEEVDKGLIKLEENS